MYNDFKCLISMFRNRQKIGVIEYDLDKQRVCKNHRLILEISTQPLLVINLQKWQMTWNARFRTLVSNSLKFKDQLTKDVSGVKLFVFPLAKNCLAKKKQLETLFDCTVT